MINIIKSTENYNLCWKYLDKNFKIILIYITDKNNKFIKNGLVTKFKLNEFGAWDITTYRGLDYTSSKELGLATHSYNLNKATDQNQKNVMLYIKPNRIYSNVSF